jgi:hypothetical protein
MLMPRTNLYYGWEYLRGGYNDSTPVDSDRDHDVSSVGTYDVFRLAGDPSVVPRRKYFTLIYMTVSSMALHQAALCLARLATTCRGVLIFSSRYTPSHGVAHTSRMPRTSWPHSTLSLDSSNRQSSCPIVHHFVLTPDTRAPHLLCRLADVKPLVWAYKFSREIARRMPHFRGEPTVLHPAFAPGGPASVVAHAEGPIAFDTPQIVYSEEDERALDAYVRNRGG